MAVTKEEIIEAIKEMPALELSELVHELEDVFGVSAAAPVMMGGPVAAADAAPAEEKTSFDVVLEGYGENKIAVIKAVRELTTLGLKEAKDLARATGDDEVWEGMTEDTLTKTKEMLDDMHKRKIDMADEIFVINVGGYIGSSTRSEIEYAKATGKTVYYLE